MKSKYLIPTGIAIALIAVIFFFGKTTTPHKDIDLTASGPMSGGQKDVKPAQFDSLLNAAKKKLSPSEQAAILAEEGSVTRGDVKDQQIKSYENLGKLWQKKNRAIAAYYFAESGKLENSEKKLNFAAHLISEDLHDEMDPAKKLWMMNVAEESYNRSLELNPKNDSVKIDLALLYVNSGMQPMKGIQLLLGIVQEEPENIQANVVLGKFAVESGQFDKAIERGNKILSFDKNNMEAHLFLGEAYKRKGETAKAVEMFRDAEKIMNNPDFTQDMEQYISSFQ